MAILDIDGQPVDIDLTLAELDKADCEESLYFFLEKAWPYIDGSTFTHGWPIQAVAEHLEAVARGDIRRLIINIPPRCAKSSLVSVAFPAWTWAQPKENWGPTCGPQVQFLHASYAQQLSVGRRVQTPRRPEYQDPLRQQYERVPPRHIGRVRPDW